MLDTSATSSTAMSSAFLLSASSRHSNASFFASIFSCGNVTYADSKIKPRVANGLGDCGRDEVIDRFAGADALANLRGGKAQRKAAQGSHAEAGGSDRRAFAGPRDGNEFDGSRQFIRRAPLVELRDVVGADEVEQLGFGEAASVLAHGVDRVRGAAATEFVGVNFVASLSGEGESQHPCAQLGRRGFALGFER